MKRVFKNCFGYNPFKPIVNSKLDRMNHYFFHLYIQLFVSVLLSASIEEMAYNFITFSQSRTDKVAGKP